MEEERDIGLIKHKIIKYGGFILLAAVILYAGWYIYTHRNKDYSTYETTSTMEIDTGVPAKYAGFASGIIRYTTDGISYIRSGKEIWNKSVSIQNPMLDICGDYIVIAEQKSNNISIFNKAGEQWDITMSYPVMSVEISGKGIVAAALDDGEANYIEIKDKNGDAIALGRTVVQGDGYPIDISISDDGTKLAASYLGITNGTTQSNVVFYNYSAVGQNEVDRIVGGFNQYKTAIVPKVEFISNNVAAAFGTDLFTIYSIKQKPSIIREEELDRKIESIFYNKGYIGIVFRNENQDKPYLIKTYSAGGEKILSMETDYQYKGILFADDKVMMYNENSCRLVSGDGVTRFETQFDVAVEEMFAISESVYVIVTADSIMQIKLK